MHTYSSDWKSVVIITIVINNNIIAMVIML